MTIFQNYYFFLVITVFAGACGGKTALMYASSGPFPDAVRLLLKNGADPDIVDAEDHFSSLIFAAAEGHFDVTRVLL